MAELTFGLFTFLFGRLFAVPELEPCAVPLTELDGGKDFAMPLVLDPPLEACDVDVPGLADDIV